ncbi:DUF3311 domain-containing protein [Actinomadura rayongensis]|uniref:DUF3311 domain-containing protein n=1 Tax=Actinomadura rayongensis TaxID=1429076 RepID=A0A6I4WKI6_9ACTN|nr:DUF3311 domain-containing protein [Actinomadura rayongensis]MXQ67102.1 DUF3311 domain-containing protein [Actinomadura rayongensis]
MSSQSPERPTEPRSDRSRWNWLLVPPVLLPLAVPLFNREGPEIGGVPAFYWLQFAFIPVGVLCTVAVYRATRKRG